MKKMFLFAVSLCLLLVFSVACHHRPHHRKPPVPPRHGIRPAPPRHHKAVPAPPRHTGKAKYYGAKR